MPLTWSMIADPSFVAICLDYSALHSLVYPLHWHYCWNIRRASLFAPETFDDRIVSCNVCFSQESNVVCSTVIPCVLFPRFHKTPDIRSGRIRFRWHIKIYYDEVGELQAHIQQAAKGKLSLFVASNCKFHIDPQHRAPVNGPTTLSET